MNCRDFDAYLTSAPAGSLPSPVLEHLSRCENCRRLYDRLQNPPSVNEPRTQNIELDSAILADLKPVKPLPSDRGLVMVCMLCAALVVIVGVILWGAAGWQVQSPPPLRILVFASILFGLVASGTGVVAEMTPASRRSAYPRAVVLCSFVLFAATVSVAFHRVYDIDPVSVGRGCYLRGLATAGVTALVVLVALRRGAWFNRFASSTWIASLSAFIALLVVTVYCPVLTMSHVFMAHLASIGTVLLLGWLLGIMLRART